MKVSRNLCALALTMLVVGATACGGDEESTSKGQKAPAAPTSTAAKSPGDRLTEADEAAIKQLVKDYAWISVQLGAEADPEARAPRIEAGRRACALLSKSAQQAAIAEAGDTDECAVAVSVVGDSEGTVPQLYDDSGEQLSADSPAYKKAYDALAVAAAMTTAPDEVLAQIDGAISQYAIVREGGSWRIGIAAPIDDERVGATSDRYADATIACLRETMPSGLFDELDDSREEQETETDKFGEETDAESPFLAANVDNSGSYFLGPVTDLDNRFSVDVAVGFDTKESSEGGGERIELYVYPTPNHAQAARNTLDAQGSEDLTTATVGRALVVHSDQAGSGAKLTDELTDTISRCTDKAEATVQTLPVETMSVE